MERVFTASEVEDKMDCYGAFNRNDVICVAHCALNVDCAILKAKGLDESAWIRPDFTVPSSCRTDLH